MEHRVDFISKLLIWNVDERRQMKTRERVKLSLEKMELLSFARLILGQLRKLVFASKSIHHVCCEYFYRKKNPLFQCELTSTDNRLIDLAAQLDKTGIAVIPEYITGQRLIDLRQTFNDMTKIIEEAQPSPEKLTPAGGRLHPRSPYREYAYDEKMHMTFTFDPFKYGKAFLDLAVDELIVSVVGKYIGKKFMLQQSTVARYYPLDRNNFGSWQWHHDSWGRKINVMILLTDVTLQDQYMSFQKGSHSLYHSYEKTVKNDRFTEAEVAAIPNLEKFDCIGKAGTVFIFDANGIHRGHRSMGAIRDTVINQYTAGRYLWGFDIPRKHVAVLKPNQAAFLNNNPHIKYTDNDSR